MKNAVLKRFVFITLITLVVSTLVCLWLVGDYNLNQTKASMIDAVKLIDYSLDYSKDINEQINKINPLIVDSSSRITVIDKNGVVLGDTYKGINYEDNHLQRPEVVEALKNGRGIDVRMSDTTNDRMLYVAQVCSDNEHILRVSVPYNGKVYLALWMLPAVVLSSIFAFIVSVLFSRHFTNTVSKPLQQVTDEIRKIQDGDYSSPLKVYEYDEITQIASAAHNLAQKIKLTMEEIVTERNKAQYVLNNMSEGLVLCDKNGYVSSMNKVANVVLGCGNVPIGKHIVNYTRNVDVINGVADAYNKGKTVIFDFDAPDGRIISANITRATENSDIGVIMVLIDVTTDRETQKLRQEFFSNASHELKTPITSIQGYSELLTSGMEYPPEQKKEFLLRIKKEAQNMTTLINDILMISRLEAGTTVQSKNEFDISLMLDEIFLSAKPMIDEQKLKVVCNCPSIIINAEYKRIYELFNNVIINAVKYNKPEGSVNINVNCAGKKLHFNVKDTGIGIPDVSQQRVFERFYRVDKGRSKKIGGTGLGLAIVKHIVNYYKGTVTLRSKLGEGTEIDILINL
jgi:two-component system phosphate regulon sensor histidine kinase PhoR